MDTGTPAPRVDTNKVRVAEYHNLVIVQPQNGQNSGLSDVAGDMGKYAGNALKKIVGIFVSHHNKIQLLGYELANLVLITKTFIPGEKLDAGAVLEIFAAVTLLVGSTCIWFYNPIQQPTMLFYGGVGLTFGGVFLSIAGYPMTGVSVILASLETVRGGIYSIIDHYKSSHNQHRRVDAFTRRTLRVSTALFGWYVKLVKAVTGRFRKLGDFIDNRPFLSGALIKAPLRLEFIIKKIMVGDFVGASVGLSWMILGDGGLALNDSKLKAKLQSYSNT